MTTTRTQPPETPRPCIDCGETIILAHPPSRPGAWAPYDAPDLDPDSVETIAGYVVLVNGQAWRHRELLEHYAIDRELGEERARELVTGWPFHRPHHCPRATNDQEAVPE